jgi:chaperonin cofactor prefoldin
MTEPQVWALIGTLAGLAGVLIGAVNAHLSSNQVEQRLDDLRSRIDGLVAEQRDTREQVAALRARLTALQRSA